MSTELCDDAIGIIVSFLKYLDPMNALKVCKAYYYWTEHEFAKRYTIYNQNKRARIIRTKKSNNELFRTKDYGVLTYELYYNDEPVTDILRFYKGNTEIACLSFLSDYKPTIYTNGPSEYVYYDRIPCTIYRVNDDRSYLQVFFMKYNSEYDTTIFIDDRNNVLLYAGCYREERFLSYKLPEEDKHLIFYDTTKGILVDTLGNIWLGDFCDQTKSVWKPIEN